MNSPAPNLFGREDAADFLEISTRTLDRYAKAKKLNPVRKKGMIFFTRAELEDVKAESNAQTPHIVSQKSMSRETTNGETTTKERYQILWEQAKKDLEQKERLLMEVNHRLGYMESELKNSVPLLESHNAHQNLQLSVAEQQDEIIGLRRRLKKAKVGKVLFLILFLLTITVGVAVYLTRGMFL